MREQEGSNAPSPLLPVISLETYRKFVAGVIMRRSALEYYLASGQRQMERRNRHLLSFLEEQGGNILRGGKLGYYLLWSESLKGPVKLPTVDQKTIKDRTTEFVETPSETSLYEDTKEDPRYLEAIASVIAYDETGEETFIGASVVRDLLRAQAENDRIERMFR